MDEQNRKITHFRVYITENCNAHCPSCVNANSRNGANMSVEMFSKLCDYLSQNGITELKIMGGEPSIHPDFEEIVCIAQKHFKYITIFSNGLNERIKNIKLRPKDCVTFNFLFRGNITKETLYLENGGERAMQVQVLKDFNEKELAKKIIEIALIDTSRIVILPSLDCTSNIFNDKEVLVPKLLYLQKTLRETGVTLSFDHTVPRCFLYGTGIDIFENSICSIWDSGIVDAEFNLRYCNTYSSKKLIKLYKDGSFIPWELVMNQLWKVYYDLRILTLNKICADCKEFNITCNGGCWIPRSNITRDDIINHSDFTF